MDVVLRESEGNGRPRLITAQGTLDDRALAARIGHLVEWMTKMDIRRVASRLDNGPSWFVLPLWRALGERWGKTYSQVREVRPRQPVMATRTQPAVAADPRLRPITAADFESYFAASVAMYTEEVGTDPIADIKALQSVSFVMKDGRVFRNETAASAQ